MAFLNKYGVARHYYIPLIKVGGNNHAVGADWTPVAGDVKISKDGGAAANVTNLPVAIAMGNSAIWDFSVTATEHQAAQLMITVGDSATKAVEDDGFVVETYGNASAEHVFDLSQATPAVNLTQVKGSAPHATILDNWLAQDLSGTATSGSTTTLVDATVLVGADTDYYKGSILLMTSGNLASVARRITAYNAATHTLTVSPAFPQAVAAQNYSILPDAGTDNIMWNGQTIPVPATAGVPSVDAVYLSGDSGAADNAESFFDGTGYAGTNNVIPSVTTVTGNVNGNVGGNLNGTLTGTERVAIADAILDRDMSVGTDSGSPTVRTMRQALRFLRNKWEIVASALTVYKENDTTPSWTSTLGSSSSANPVVSSDPP